MKLHPSKMRLELLVGLGAFGLILASGWFVFPLYHQQLIEQQYSVFLIGYLYPALLSLAFALRLKGRYWIGFSLAGILTYSLAMLLGFINADASVYTVAVALALLFIFQALLLWLKHRVLTR